MDGPISLVWLALRQGVHLRGRHDARRNRSHHQHRYRSVFSISKVLLPTYLGDSATVIYYQRAVSHTSASAATRMRYRPCSRPRGLRWCELLVHASCLSIGLETMRRFDAPTCRTVRTTFSNTATPSPPTRYCKSCTKVNHGLSLGHENVPDTRFYTCPMEPASIRSQQRCTYVTCEYLTQSS